MIYTYKSRDGEKITGLASDIVRTVLDWHGDAARNRLANHGPEPTLYAWLAVAEDRPIEHAKRDLSRHD